jgi:hypothetical protein
MEITLSLPGNRPIPAQSGQGGGVGVRIKGLTYLRYVNAQPRTG